MPFLLNIKKWFRRAKASAEVQATEIENRLRDTSDRPPEQELPKALMRKLNQAIHDLPSHPAHQAVIQDALEAAISHWHQVAEAPNSLVVLGSSVEPLAQLIHESLEDWQHPNLKQIQLLQWSTRPPDPADLSDRLKSEIEHLFQSKRQPFEEQPSEDLSPEELAALEAEIPEELQALIVIPALDWCFLRCINGLEGIEYLQNLVLRDRSQFWLIGCNHWAWRYLDHVCQISAYFEQTLSLPALNSLELKQWLSPVETDLDVQSQQSEDEPSPEKSPDAASNTDQDWAEHPEDWASQSEKQYFDTLARYSLGIGSVAAEAWVRSLSHQTPEVQSDQADDEAEHVSPQVEPSGKKKADPDAVGEVTGQVFRQRVLLPSLPSLNSEDRYILFSLLLHGEMSLAHLALSLGEDESTIRLKVQVLKRADVIELHQGRLKVNPVFYPKLRADLDGNNFLVGAEY